MCGKFFGPFTSLDRVANDNPKINLLFMMFFGRFVYEQSMKSMLYYLVCSRMI